jgi:hypothetical protein
LKRGVNESGDDRSQGKWEIRDAGLMRKLRKAELMRNAQLAKAGLAEDESVLLWEWKVSRITEYRLHYNWI